MKPILLLLALVPAIARAAFDPVAPEIFVWKNTCNTYVVRDGDAALVIDPGDGSVVGHLAEIGVKKIEWALLTGHHRELLQGIGKLDRAVTHVAGPKEEQALLETPREFRKWRPKLGDAHTVHGASYVRPPAAPIKLDRAQIGRAHV